MQIKTIIIFIVVTLGVLLGVAGLLTQFGTNADKPIIDIAGASVHTQGTGAIKIVEFSDFQCPACLIVQEPLKQILKKYEGKIEFVYRHFPLSTIHKNATSASYAAEAAFLQGKFWEMHDKLFATQPDWALSPDPKTVFAGYALELGMDKDKFLSDYDSQVVKDSVNADILAATRYALTGTPTFFVNGVNTDFAKIESKIIELSN
jgi:protein-disulfide isomerase